MRIYDISITACIDMPTWPGEIGFDIVPIQDIEKGDDANVSRLTMSAHAGTHVDAPLHFIPNGTNIEQLSLKELTGRVYVLNLPDTDLITKKNLERANIPPRTRRILFKTKNSARWLTGDQFQSDYVAISPDAAEYLVERKIRLVGIDYLSVAPFGDHHTTHHTLLDAGVIIVEGLNLAKVPPGRYTIYCLPLKIANAEAAPARVILIGA